MLHGFFCSHSLGKHHKAGGVAVKPVDDKELVARILALHIVAKKRIGRAVLDFVRTHREQAVTFVDNYYVIVLVYDFEPRIIECLELAGGVDLDGLSRFEFLVKTRGHIAVDHHLVVFEIVFDSCLAAVGHCCEEEVEESSRRTFCYGKFYYIVGAERARASARFVGQRFAAWHYWELGIINEE